MKKFLVILSILLVLVACRPPVPEQPKTVMQPPPVVPVQEAPPQAPPAQAQTVNVDISNFAYSPKTIRVKVGDTIVWSQKDSAPHTVTTTSAPEMFDSGTLPQGQTYSHTFTTPGTYEYRCAIHPAMTATVIVE